MQRIRSDKQPLSSITVEVFADRIEVEGHILGEPILRRIPCGSIGGALVLGASSHFTYGRRLTCLAKRPRLCDCGMSDCFLCVHHAEQKGGTHE